MDLDDDLLDLKKQYYEIAENIIPLFPTLLAMIDFRKNGDYKIISKRFLDGFYGSVNNGSYVPPTKGPYIGFLNAINPEDIKKFKRLMAIETEETQTK